MFVTNIDMGLMNIKIIFCGGGGGWKCDSDDSMSQGSNMTQGRNVTKDGNVT